MLKGKMNTIYLLLFIILPSLVFGADQYKLNIFTGKQDIAGPVGLYGANGNVGIGSTTPACQLDLSSGNVCVAGVPISGVGIGTVGKLAVYTGTTTVGSLGTPTVCSAGSYPLGIDSSGNATGCTVAGTGTLTGPLTSPKIPKASGATSLADSNITDTSGNIGIGGAGTTSFRLTSYAGAGSEFAGMFRSDPSGRLMRFTTNDYDDVSVGSMMQMTDGAGTGNTYTLLQGYTSGGLAVGTIVLQDGGGNVGIGTDVPPSKMYVTGTLETQAIKIHGGEASGNVLVSNSVGVGTWMPVASGSGTVNSGLINFYGKYPSTGTTIDDSAVTMDDGTNVGIGTSTPTAKLNISTSAAQDLFRVDDNGIPDTTPFIIDSTGNVGIGSATPSAILAISSTANQTLFRIDDNGTGDISPFIVDANGNVGIGTANTETDKLLVMGGNVGIGTWVPFQLLDVKGKAIISDNVGIGTTIPGGALTVMNGNVGIGTWNPIAALQIVGSGNVGIGTLIPAAALDVTGSIRMSNGTAGQVTCFKTDKTLGQCTSVVGAGGACTCS